MKKYKVYAKIREEYLLPKPLTIPYMDTSLVFHGFDGDEITFLISSLEELGERFKIETFSQLRFERFTCQNVKDVVGLNI